jgi:hypothetical protein
LELLLKQKVNTSNVKKVGEEFLPDIQRLFSQMQMDSGARAKHELEKIMTVGSYVISNPTSPIGAIVLEDKCLYLKIASSKNENFTLDQLEDLRNRLVCFFCYWLLKF